MKKKAYKRPFTIDFLSSPSAGNRAAIKRRRYLAMGRFGGGLGAGRREAPKIFNKEYYFDDNQTIGGLMRAPPKADGGSPLGRSRQSRAAARPYDFIFFTLTIMAAAEGGRRSPPNKEAVKGLPREWTVGECLGSTENRCEEPELGRTDRDKVAVRRPLLYAPAEYLP